jgi:hypothetical protein
MRAEIHSLNLVRGEIEPQNYCFHCKISVLRRVIFTLFGTILGE